MMKTVADIPQARKLLKLREGKKHKQFDDSQLLYMPVNPNTLEMLKNFIPQNWPKQLKNVDIVVSLPCIFLSFVIEIWARTTLYLYYKGFFLLILLCKAKYSNYIRFSSDIVKYLFVLNIDNTKYTLCYISDFNYTNCSHALCNAHLLRELTGIEESDKQQWPVQMKELLLEIKQRVDDCDGALPETARAFYEAKYDATLTKGDEENPIQMAAHEKGNRRGRPRRSKARNLLDRMKLYKADILKFMAYPEVPFDNNQAERDIRMAKLQQKVSGGFRSEQGSEMFDNIRSYISTASKQEISMFVAIQNAVSGNPLFIGNLKS